MPLEEREIPLTARLWLHMLREGGHWSVAELAKHAGQTRQHIHDAMQKLVRGECATVHPRPGCANGVAYSVHPRSRVPAGIPVAQVAEALHLRPAPRRAPIVTVLDEEGIPV